MNATYGKTPRRIWKRIVVWPLVPVLIACIAYFVFLQEGGSQEMTRTDTALKRAIPPIDQRIPNKIETATFALG